jgi:hypothetical protein
MIFRAAAIAIVLAACGAAPASAQIKRFGGWLASCDNARDCTAYSIERGSMHGYLRITRGATASANAVITLAIATEQPYRIRIEMDPPDLELLPTGPLDADKIERDGHVRFSREIAPDVLVAALRKATLLDVNHVEKPQDWFEANIERIRFDGVLEALAWIDAQQKRTGTVTAFVRTGPKTMVAVPEPPALPLVIGAAATSEPAPKDAPAAILRRGNAICGKQQRASELASIVRLDRNRLMYAFTCEFYSSSASQHQAHLIAQADKPQAAVKPRFVIPPQVAPHLTRIGATERKGAVLNPEFNSETLTLTSFGAYRGAGDCGELIEWVWTGREFQMAELRKMPDCEAIPASDWPVLYRTTRKQP